MQASDFFCFLHCEACVFDFWVLIACVEDGQSCCTITLLFDIGVIYVIISGENRVSVVELILHPVQRLEAYCDVFSCHCSLRCEGRTVARPSVIKLLLSLLEELLEVFFAFHDCLLLLTEAFPECLIGFILPDDSRVYI